ncbi:sugar phosphate isomerase/epimerase family protein [Brucella sp. NBRC 12950]|uniref:sugar phosphate isomerase/epimerase family protein n=1 Tax=Brucella sp. NBRC 12950 TaxID=2994518 RepID=UPI0024A233BA|nr:sugar phosphate isomerase/epimerase family protein [Brucella sp. NBRC 12950]GLU30016.1 sugar phosphate isomerase [Brucella sp. NBRC 12950]
MTSKTDKLIFHSLASKCPLGTDIDVARKLGFDGLETSGPKIESYLSAGFTAHELRAKADGLMMPGIGFLIDLERQGDDRAIMLEEAHRLCELAAVAGAKGIEVITGPLELRAYEKGSEKLYPHIYRGLLDRSFSEQLTMTAENLRLVADMAADFGLIVYLEGLSWTPLKTIESQVRVLELCDRSNTGLVIDFWHCYTAGQTLDQVAALDSNLIYGVHVCDSLPFDGGVPDEKKLRNVSTGAGILPLDEWVDAVRATGFKGWWSCELFCERDHYDSVYDVARNLKSMLENLIRK